MTDVQGDPSARMRCADATLNDGWNRLALGAQIDGRLHNCREQAITDFSKTFSLADPDVAQQIPNDPYQFEFLSLAATAKDHELARRFLIRGKDVLLETCKGPPSRAASTISRSSVRIGMSISCSTTGSCAASSPSTSK